MVLSPVQIPDAPVERVLARLKGVRKSLHGWVACCPAHSDREPSLSIGLGDEGQVLLTCFAGCSLEQIVEAMGITLADLFPKAASVSVSQPEQTQHNVLTLVDLASDKLLHWKYLLHLGVTEQRAGCLQIPYHLPDGTPAPRHRLRTALVAKEGSHWSKGSGEIVPYGLERLEEAQEGGLSRYRGGRVRLLDTLVPPLSGTRSARRRDGTHAQRSLPYWHRHAVYRAGT